MAYIAAHNYAVFYAEETTLITESTNGTTAPTIPAAPGSTALLGYLPSTPELDRALNNSLGFAIGSPNALYHKRGVRSPKLSFKIRITNVAFLAMATRVNGVLSDLCLNLVIPGVRTVQCRFCKIEQLGLSFNETATGEAGEIEADVQIECMVVNDITALNPDIDALTVALDTPMYWHDVRSISLTSAAAVVTNYRDSIMAFSATIKHNLERKGSRQNFGDNVGASITNLHLLEHQQNITGEMRLHGYLPPALFNATNNAQDWGDTIVVISDTPSGGEREYTLTLGSCFPQNVTETGTEASGQLSSTVPFFAQTWVLADTAE